VSRVSVHRAIWN